MNLSDIKNCPSTLKNGYKEYSNLALKKVFDGKKIAITLPYESPINNETSNYFFNENIKRISISGVQEKFSLVLDKNKLRLVEKNEQGTHILKPIPSFGKRSEQMPANEHLTMQIAQQVFGIETAPNAIIFFKNGAPAYITKRFDINENGEKLAQEDFASLAQRTPQTHGEDFKYLGNYLQLFELLQKNCPAYIVESPKLFKLILFNYLFSNSDAHFKNFSLLETPLGDFRLSPAYDLLNSKIHIDDRDFALNDGLLPSQLAKGKIKEQFYILGKQANIKKAQIDKIILLLCSNSDKVEQLINASFLDKKTKENYLQAYQTRLQKLKRS